MPKSKHLIPGRVRSTYDFIKAHRNRYSVQMPCRVLEVAVSGYYDWINQRISNHAQKVGRLVPERTSTCGRRYFWIIVSALSPRPVRRNV
jgi:hypothetical protein